MKIQEKEGTEATIFCTQHIFSYLCRPCLRFLIKIQRFFNDYQAKSLQEILVNFDFLEALCSNHSAINSIPP
jgi:hypothetical protein